MSYTYEDELDIANTIESLYNCRIIKSESEPYSLYCCCDIANILKFKNIRSANFESNEKVEVKINTNKGFQTLSFVTIYGLIKLLNKSRKPEALNISRIMNINIYQHKFPCIESQTINDIIKAFDGENIIRQYQVDVYRVDLYFIDYKLAVECDEKHHSWLFQEDILRQNKIMELLECRFIRYSPLDKDFNIFDVINNIFKIIKSNLLKN